MAQEKYLSPGEILKYLCDLESKLPQRNFKLYIQSQGGAISEGELNKECKKMLDFAGMEGYKTDVRYAPLQDGMAGNTIPGDTAGNIVHINVSSDLKYNRRASLATLAHEICHQVIYRYGIRPGGINSQLLTEVLETYTDLCTIYLGFGQLILDGYDTDEGGKHRTLGYLDRNTYQVTHHLVCVVCGGANSKNTGFEGSDIFADEAIALWESEADKKSIVKKEFQRNSIPYASPLSLIEHMESLLRVYRDYLKTDIERYSKAYVNNCSTIANEHTQKLAAFRIVYNICLEKKSVPKMVNDNALETALYSLFMDVKTQYGRVIFNREFICPCCGRKYTPKETKVGNKHVKCTCGAHFIINTDEWNPTRMQRREEMKRIEKRDREELELENLRRKVCAEEKSAAWKETEQLRKELSNIRDGIEKLPYIFRWMVNKRINKK